MLTRLGSRSAKKETDAWTLFSRSVDAALVHVKASGIAAKFVPARIWSSQLVHLGNQSGLTMPEDAEGVIAL